MALKKEEEADLLQRSFGFYDPPVPKLRVQSVVPSNNAAAIWTLHSEGLSRSGVFCYPSGAQRTTGARSRYSVPFALGVLGWQMPRTQDNSNRSAQVLRFRFRAHFFSGRNPQRGMNVKLYRALPPLLHAYANGYSGATDTAMTIESSVAKSPVFTRDIQKADTINGRVAA